ncbi:hypothetical protein WN51_08472 [Melipona quadrifasciata]|uniref:Uncharacterized protein n=1 Tax=Melipona quadrifasciata TaxID=166423 RepID=A0A0M9AA19_9HYME|nr:hypothetical protein WN51_08472 [Melipona quadrifasciata]
MAVRQVRVNNRYRSAGRSVFVTGRGKVKEKGTRKQRSSISLRFVAINRMECSRLFRD